MPEWLTGFLQQYRPYVDAAQALSAVVNIVGWSAGSVLIYRAWRTNGIHSVQVGPLSFRMQQEAIEATAAAARGWAAEPGGDAIDVSRIRSSVQRAFDPETADQLLGKSILWVDDNPRNNELAVRAFKRLQLEVEQVLSTDAALAALDRRRYSLIISDMGRGTNMQAGYDLLQAVRVRDKTIPVFIFASQDKPEYRAEAKRRGAQLSTNSVIELIDEAITYLSRAPRAP